MSLQQQDYRYAAYLPVEAGPSTLPSTYRLNNNAGHAGASMSSAYTYRLPSPPQYAHGHLVGQLYAGNGVSPGYSSASASPPEMQSIKKRQPRSNLACTVCRHKKSRCDGDGKNACSHCKHHGKQCKYAAVPKEVNDRIRGERKAAKWAKQIALQRYQPY